MRNFYAKLLPELALQEYRGLDIDEIILSGMEGMDRRLREQTADWPRDRLLCLQYDELSQAPMDVLHRIYAAFGYDGFEQDQTRFERYLSTIRDYKTNRYDQPESLAPEIRNRLNALASLPAPSAGASHHSRNL